MAAIKDFPNALTPRFAAGCGYWFVVACTGAIVLSNTPLAPFATGIIFVALIYQTNQLIAGK